MWIYDPLLRPRDGCICVKPANEKAGIGLRVVPVTSTCIYSCSICVYLLGGGLGLTVRVCVCWGGGCWKRGWNEQDLDWRMAGRGGWWWWWNKHLEVTQVDSGLVCSLYQWGPGPWALGVYLSSWGTTAHYSPPIMPHRAPFLCLNWGAVCAPMNYSIYLLCCSEVCLEKLLQTPECPRVHSLIYANSGVFSIIFLPFRHQSHSWCLRIC